MSDENKHEDRGSEPSDPAAAFEALRQTVEKQSVNLNAEMKVIRQGLEAAFEQFDTINQPIDYSADIANLNEGYKAVADYIEMLAASPFLKHGPEYIGRKLEGIGEGVVQTAASELTRQSQELERVANNLARQVRDVRSRKARKRLMWLGGMIGFLVATGFFIVLLRILPIGLVSDLIALVR